MQTPPCIRVGGLCNFKKMTVKFGRNFMDRCPKTGTVFMQNGRRGRLIIPHHDLAG